MEFFFLKKVSFFGLTFKAYKSATLILLNEMSTSHGVSVYCKKCFKSYKEKSSAMCHRQHSDLLATKRKVIFDAVKREDKLLYLASTSKAFHKLQTASYTHCQTFKIVADLRG